MEELGSKSVSRDNVSLKGKIIKILFNDTDDDDDDHLYQGIWNFTRLKIRFRLESLS